MQPDVRKYLGFLSINYFTRTHRVLPGCGHMTVSSHARNARSSYKRVAAVTTWYVGGARPRSVGCVVE